MEKFRANFKKIMAPALIAVMVVAMTLATACGTSLKASVEIQCKYLSEDMTQLTDQSVKEYIPEDGEFLSTTEVKFEEGDTAYDVLEEICKENDIQLEATDSSYGKYITSIGNLSASAVGANAGWMFKVNGETPSVGADSYELQDGDEIVWYFVCDYTTQY